MADKVKATKQGKSLTPGGAALLPNTLGFKDQRGLAEVNENKQASLGPLDRDLGSPNGVGGDNDKMFSFQIGTMSVSPAGVPTLSKTETVHIELAPARRSFYEKSGQQSPGAGAGLEIKARANVVKLNVPGSRPIYQYMGIAEETIEWVGCFIGRDVESGDAFSGITGHRGAKAPGQTGWAQSNALTSIFRRGRELAIMLQWTRQEDKPNWTHTIAFQNPDKYSNTIWYTGFIKEFTRVYAHEDRVYYRVVFVVTNRQDINQGIKEAAPLGLPPAFVIGANEPTPAQAKIAMDLRNQQQRNKGYTDEEIKTQIPAGFSGTLTKSDGITALDESDRNAVSLASGVANSLPVSEAAYTRLLNDPDDAKRLLNAAADAKSVLTQYKSQNPNIVGPAVTRIEKFEAKMTERHKQRVNEINTKREPPLPHRLRPNIPY